MNGWTTQVVVDSETGQRGLRALLEPGSQTGQGHADQWLAVLAQCGLDRQQPIRIEEDCPDAARLRGTGAMGRAAQSGSGIQLDTDWSNQLLADGCSMAASDGQLWSIEKLVGIETEQELASSACGGTHRLIGLAMALNRHLDQDGRVTGVWSQADAVIQAAIETCSQFQNADGSFSTRYFEGPGSSPDSGSEPGHDRTHPGVPGVGDDGRSSSRIVGETGSGESLRSVSANGGRTAWSVGPCITPLMDWCLYRERLFGRRSYANSGEAVDAG